MDPRRLPLPVVRVIDDQQHQRIDRYAHLKLLLDASGHMSRIAGQCPAQRACCYVCSRQLTTSFDPRSGLQGISPLTSHHSSHHVLAERHNVLSVSHHHHVASVSHHVHNLAALPAHQSHGHHVMPAQSTSNSGSAQASSGKPKGGNSTSTAQSTSQASFAAALRSLAKQQFGDEAAATQAALAASHARLTSPFAQQSRPPVSVR